MNQRDIKSITISEIKEGINNFLGKYGPLKTNMNHFYSARSSFNLSAVEEEEIRTLKGMSDNQQIRSNKINNKINAFKGTDEELQTIIDWIPKKNEPLQRPK